MNVFRSNNNKLIDVRTNAGHDHNTQVGIVSRFFWIKNKSQVMCKSYPNVVLEFLIRNLLLLYEKFEGKIYNKLKKTTSNYFFKTEVVFKCTLNSDPSYKWYAIETL